MAHLGEGHVERREGDDREEPVVLHRLFARERERERERERGGVRGEGLGGLGFGVEHKKADHSARKMITS